MDISTSTVVVAASNYGQSFFYWIGIATVGALAFIGLAFLGYTVINFLDNYRNQTNDKDTISSFRR